MLIIAGPTAIGKTKIAVSVAHKISGEIVSADSRQVYKGLDIGSGKDLAEYSMVSPPIPYHLIDNVKPYEEYNVYRFQADATQAINSIISRGVTPILCGGTGMYLSSLLQGYRFKPKNDSISRRNELETLSLSDLQELLKRFGNTHHNTTDFLVKERLVERILIEESEATERINQLQTKLTFPFLLTLERAALKTRIRSRLESRLEGGLIEEVHQLLDSGIPEKKLLLFGLEYRYVTMFIRKELYFDEMFQKLLSGIFDFAKRQVTWFRKMQREGVAFETIDSSDPDEAIFQILSTYNQQNEIGNNGIRL
mgnify:CR=1 FL=1